MLGNMGRPRPRAKSEGERPFWISYADLMTAMMVLFLVAMAVTIAAVTRAVEGPAEIRARQVMEICTDLKNGLADASEIDINCASHRITFPDVGYFDFNSYRLPEGAAEALARLVPAVLEAADSELGQRWLKQVVVEGYTDPVGSYLYNLHLSLQRSEYVLCLLMDPAKNSSLALHNDQLERVRQLFLAGGVSFNNQRETDERSRRVELRIQFYGLDEEPLTRVVSATGVATDRCQL